jgi:hypothetical protein
VYFTYLQAGELATPEGDARAARYNVGGLWPSAYFDGASRAPQVSEPDSFYAIFANMADGARSQPTVLEMSLDTLLTSADSAQVQIGVHITPTDSVVDRMSGLRLVTVLFQDSVPYDQFGDTLYLRGVVRCVVGDTWGVPVHLTFGAGYDTTIVAPTATGWQPRLLGVAAFVQDTADMQVLQSVVKYRIEN